MKLKHFNCNCKNCFSCRLILFIFFIVLYGCSCQNIFAQSDIKVYQMFDDIIVTANRVPTAFGQVARNLIILDRRQIAAMPAQTIQDLLGYIAGVDVRQQAVQGMQADVSIRGTTFEQTLILLDGVKLSDPQTGHHNMNLPVSLDDVERIEILKGQGSRLYGPNAFGGVISIITRNFNKKQLRFSASGGSYAFIDAGLSAALPLKRLQQQVSVKKNRSEGYRENTDFDYINFAYAANLDIGNSRFDADFGYSKRQFGANGFYGIAAERQWEETETRFSQLGLTYHRGDLTLAPKVYFRTNNDHYIWNREHPEWYENFHKTGVYSAELQSHLKTPIGTTSLGVESSYEKISSNRLGKYRRDKNGIYLEQQFSVRNRLHVTTGFSAFNYSEWGWASWPGLDVAAQIADNQKLTASLGKAFRVPTYTELYYQSRSNIGNADLREEEAWSGDLGYALQWKKSTFDVAIFQRNSRNLIDWVWADSDSLWRAENITEIRTRGFEMSTQIAQPRPFLQQIRFSYAYLRSNKESAGYRSKYVFDHLRHQAVLGIDFSAIGGKLQQSWNLKYADRLQFEDYFVVDLRLRYKLKHLEVFFDVNNLFDENYREYVFIPQPGRWLKLGVNYSVFTP